MKTNRRTLCIAIGLAIMATAPLALTGCGGGGGGGSSMTAPTAPPPPPPPPAPNPPPPPPPPAPAPSTYNQGNNQLVPTGVTTAWKAGFTGAGVKVGVADGGIIPTDPTLNGSLNSAGRNKVVWFHNYTPGATNPSTPTVVDGTGHGDAMSQLIAGDPDWTAGTATTFASGLEGGVAPGASLYEAAICYPASSTSGPLCHPSTQEDQDLIAQGVQIVNESYDATDITTIGGAAGSQALGAEAASKPLADAGVLQVVATGDDPTQKNAGIYSGLPYLFPSLQSSVIAVTGALIDQDGKPSTASTITYTNTSTNSPIGNGYVLTSNATPCGVAAAWCITAPLFMAVLPDSLSFTSGLGTGTSASAAIVTGVAALVAQAYPWMKAPQLAQTILTTATPLGTGPYPNPQFGWGFVNAAAAVNGPMQFLGGVYGAFAAQVPAGMTSTFSNDIAGAGGLLVNGAGTLALSGTDTYTGSTEVSSGTLQVDGSITSPVTTDYNPAVFGTLSGTGTVNAAVTNNGAVTSQGSAAGQGLTITGNLTDGANSATNVALGDPLTVKGTASLAGTMNVLGAPTGYTVKSTEDLLDAGSIANTFGNLTFASGVFYTGALNYSSTQVSVTLTQASPLDVALAAPQATAQTVASAGNIGKALDVSNGWVESGNTSGHGKWLQDAGSFLSAPSAENALVSMNSLSGEIYASSRAVEAEQSLAADAALQNRQVSLFNTTRPGVWAQALGANGALARSGYDATDYMASGVMVGADTPLGDSGVSVGVAAGRIRTNSDMTGLGGRVDGREDMAAVYALWTLPNQWYVAGRASFAHIKNGVSRSALLGTALVNLTGNRTDRVEMATVEGGKRIAIGDAGTLTPYVSATDLQIHQGGFTEYGSSMGLSAASQDHNATFGTVGLRYAATLPGQMLGGTTHYNVYAGYRHAFTGADMGITASFAGMPSVTFRAEGQNLPSNLGIVGARLDTQITQQWSWFVDADYQSGNGGAHQVEADIGLRASF